MAKLISAFIESVLDYEKKYPNDAELGANIRELIRVFKSEEGKE